MSIIYGVLEEERSHLESALALYEAKVAALPGGCLWVRSQGKRKYAYLARREKGSVRFTYVGPIPSRKHAEVELQIKERKSLEASIRNMRKDLRVIERTLRYAGRSKRAA